MSENLQNRRPEEPQTYVENTAIAHKMANAMSQDMDDAIALKARAHEIRNTEIPEHDEDDYETDDMAEQELALDWANDLDRRAENHVTEANKIAQKVWDSREEEEEEEELER